MSKWKCNRINCFCSCVVNLDSRYLPVYCLCFSAKTPDWELVKNEPEQFENSEQLPKLTVEVFDRPFCPEWSRYAAVDKDGEGWYYEEKPVVGDSHNFVNTAARARKVDGEFDATDWQNSLIERPQKVTLTDWCKVGAWVFDSNDGYGKITSIQEDRLACYIEFDGGAGGFAPESFAKLKQARLRPYNSDEMLSLLGKVIEHDNLFLLVTYYDGRDNDITLNGYVADAKRLLNEGFTINGKPCGVLEHLNDNGEWVE